jgi:hypothetical protein
MVAVQSLLYNEKEASIFVLCVMGLSNMLASSSNLEILPPTKRSLTTFSAVEFLHSTQLLNEELQTSL